MGLRIAPFVFGLLCFVMPFMEVSCSGQTQLTMSGVQMVTGTQMTNPLNGQSQPVSGDLFATIALVCVLAALALSFSSFRSKAIGCALASGLAILALIILKERTEQTIMQQAQGAPVTVSFLYGFWLLAFALSTGLVLSIARIQKRE
jgi:hypothetical protein